MSSPPSVQPGAAFGAYTVRIDPWAVEYGGETPTEFQPEPDDTPALVLDVEQPTAAWAPIAPAHRTSLPGLSFVDGVRRMEARLVVSKAGRSVHGALGAYGVGVVRCQDGRATFAQELVGRVAIFGAGETPPRTLTLDSALAYEPRSVAEEDPDAPLRGLHGEMRVVEGQVARAHAAEPDHIVIADGPLNIGDATPGRVVGFVKRLFKLYLPPELLPVLRALPTGARTPVFLIEGQGRFARYSWFLRVGPRLPIESDYTGLVRLEVSETVGRDEALRLADVVSAALPRFVPSRTRDPRAPQNLVPIGALEQHLRRRLGDARLIQRRLASRLARELPHA